MSYSFFWCCKQALQELLEIINKSGVEEIVASLPNWTVFYLMLTVDSDRKVRELTQVFNLTFNNM